MNLKGKIITIEGTDGTGKQTQTAMLKEKLKQAGYEVLCISYPNYESDSSAAVKMYLNGEIRKNPNDISPKAASTFFAVDRYITYKQYVEPVYKAGKAVILCDRYTESNIIHQASKYVMTMKKEGFFQSDEQFESVNCTVINEFVKWIHNFEHRDLGIPEADVTIYLDVPIEYSIKLMQERVNKIDGSSKKDIHESDVEYLKSCNLTGKIASTLLRWNIIDCVNDGGMRSVEDISDEIWHILKKL